MDPLNIWPSRTIVLPEQQWLSDDQQLLVAGEIASLQPNRIPQPVMLEERGIRMIALVRMGDDGIGIGNTLLLRVTDELAPVGTIIRLQVVTYPYTGAEEMMLLRPDQAADILNRHVRGIRRALNLGS